MELNRGSNPGPGRVLVVADWTADPEGIVAACVERHGRLGGDFTLVVSASLHGLDWVSDPAASVPCAHRQLTAIGRLADAAGITFHVAGVGDPDPVAAICDALHPTLTLRIYQQLLKRKRREEYRSRVNDLLGTSPAALSKRPDLAEQEESGPNSGPNSLFLAV
jgi:hypothetical protein